MKTAFRCLSVRKRRIWKKEEAFTNAINNLISIAVGGSLNGQDETGHVIEPICRACGSSTDCLVARLPLANRSLTTNWPHLSPLILNLYFCPSCTLVRLRPYPENCFASISTSLVFRHNATKCSVISARLTCERNLNGEIWSLIAVTWLLAILQGARNPCAGIEPAVNIVASQLMSEESQRLANSSMRQLRASYAKKQADVIHARPCSRTLQFEWVVRSISILLKQGSQLLRYPTSGDLIDHCEFTQFITNISAFL
jgi:hypothetical protein